MMDANLLKKGEDFDKLPETWVIFITENDVMRKGLSVYPVKRCFLETGEKHDFFCTNAADVYYGTLAGRVRFFKESKEGIEIMCRAMEDMRNQTLKEGAINSAKRMLADGILTLEKTARTKYVMVDYISIITAVTVQYR